MAQLETYPVDGTISGGDKVLGANNDNSDVTVLFEMETISDYVRSNTVLADVTQVTSQELNILSGATLSTTELNSLTGTDVTSTEFNILGGATLTTAELNFVDGVTSNIQTQLNTITENDVFDGNFTTDIKVTKTDPKITIASSEAVSNLNVIGELLIRGLNNDDPVVESDYFQILSQQRLLVGMLGARTTFSNRSYTGEMGEVLEIVPTFSANSLRVTPGGGPTPSGQTALFTEASLQLNSNSDSTPAILQLVNGDSTPNDGERLASILFEARDGFGAGSRIDAILDDATDDAEYASIVIETTQNGTDEVESFTIGRNAVNYSALPLRIGEDNTLHEIDSDTAEDLVALTPLPDGDGTTQTSILQTIGALGSEVYSWVASSGSGPTGIPDAPSALAASTDYALRVPITGDPTWEEVASGGTYILPAATSTTLGGVIVEGSSAIDVDTDGKIVLGNINQVVNIQNSVALTDPEIRFTGDGTDQVLGKTTFYFDSSNYRGGIKIDRNSGSGYTFNIDVGTITDAVVIEDDTSLRLGSTGTKLTNTDVTLLTSITATATELNVLDGITSSTAELNILDGVTATATEINIIDGVTATTDEINILDGVTASTAEINVTDGLTATTSELNIMDGVTATTTEINLLDGKTASDFFDATSDITFTGDVVLNPASGKTAPYFQGGLRVGGNTSANELDDYEEGTWTPTAVNFTGTGSETDFTDKVASYTKIGRIVHLKCNVRVPLNTDTSNIQISGIPFAAGGTTGGTGTASFLNASSENQLDSVIISSASSELLFNNGKLRTTYAEVSQGSFGLLREFRFETTYETTT